jgi:hypothetical protein
MDFNAKLNLTFMIFSMLSILFIKVANKNKYEPSNNLRAFVGFVAGVSFLGFITTCLVRIWA